MLGELTQKLGELLSLSHALVAVLGKLLKVGADLLADRRVGRHMVSELMQGRGNLLLLLRDDLLWLAQLLAELVAKDLLAAKADPRIDQARAAEPQAADLGTGSLQGSVAGYRCTGCPEEGGCQRLSEIRSIVSVRHDILHWLSSD
jgi:hypothetical protein